MAVAALLLAFFSGLLCFLGFLTAVIPVVGAVLAFSAPVAALVGIWLGGVTWSRARLEGRAVELPIVAVVMNVFALVPAVLVALTCGVCNAVVSSGPIHVQKSFGTVLTADGDGGVPFPFQFPAPMRARQRRVWPDAGVDQNIALPPPRLPAGPRTPLPAVPPPDRSKAR